MLTQAQIIYGEEMKTPPTSLVPKGWAGGLGLCKYCNGRKMDRLAGKGRRRHSFPIINIPSSIQILYYGSRSHIIYAPIYFF